MHTGEGIQLGPLSKDRGGRGREKKGEEQKGEKEEK